MRKQLASHLELALVMPDAIEAWNTVVRVRKLTLVVDYTTHTPMLMVGVPSVSPLMWMLVDTRRKKHIKLRVMGHPDVQHAVDHLDEALAKVGLRLTLMFKRDAQQRKTVSMRLVSNTGGPMTAVLHTVPKGSRVEYQEFKLTDKWS